MFVKSSKHDFILMLDPNEHKGFELSFCYFKTSECSVQMFCWISLPNIVAFQLLFVGCLTHDSSKVPTSTFKSRHHQKKASPFFPLPQPLIMSCSSSSLDLSKASTHWHLPTFIFGKAGGTLEYCWSIAGLH